MKKGLLFLSFLICAVVGFAQLRPAGLPSPNSTGYGKIGYQQADSGLIQQPRDTFPAKYPTLIRWSGDGTFWQTLGNGARWFPLASGSLRSIYAGYGLTKVNDSTLGVDTALIATRLRVQKAVDSLGVVKQPYNANTTILGNTTTGSGGTIVLSGSPTLTLPSFTGVQVIGGIAAMPTGSGTLAYTSALSPYKLISDTLFNGGYTTRNTTKKIADSLAALISGGGFGTVQSVSTTDGVGIVSSVASPTANPNISIRVDTNTIATRLRVQKGIDSLGSVTNTALGLKLNISDTAAMLTPNYRRTITKITNSDLVNSTISGTALGSNLPALSFGTYLQNSATSYNGTTANTISTNATSSNTGSTLVARDINGDFAARNITGSLSGNASSASTALITNDNTTNATMYPIWSSASSGNNNLKSSSSKITFNPSTGVLTSSFSGALSGNATTASTLQTARTINGVPFDGSANISISASVDSSLSAGYGLTGSPFDGSLGRTWVVDTTKIIPYTDTLYAYGIATKSDIRNSPSGTVTSIATNINTGITGGTITSSGTLAIDTALISTRLWRQKGIDSIMSLVDSMPVANTILRRDYAGSIKINLPNQGNGIYNLISQNGVTGQLEAAFLDSVRTYQLLRPRQWRYDGGNGNRLGNTAYGLYTLDSVTEGTHNILIGKIPDTATAEASFQGRFNLSMGASVLPVARYISDFTAVGSNIGAVMDSGFYSTLIGHNILNKSTNGSKVTSVGAFSLLEATNVVDVDNIGFEGLRYNKTGSFISNIGAKGLLQNSTGNFNFNGGYQGLYQNTTASNNTNVGALGFIDLRPISDSISDFSDYSGTVAGTTKATSVSHGRTTGQSLIISGSANYNGTYSITKIDNDNFYFTKTYVANDSVGWWTLQGAEGKNNTSIGANGGSGLVYGSANTFIGANSVAPSSSVNNNIIISDGDGNTRLRHDSTKWVANTIINYNDNKGSLFTARTLVDKNYVDSSVSFVGGGTVTSVATNNGSGITGGTFTTSGTISADTSILSTKANVTASILGKLNISDTATMLSGYRLKSVPITNADLQYYQISGISLGSNLFNLNTPYGLSGTNYNGSAPVSDWSVDTTLLSTRAWRQKGIDSIAALIPSVSGYKLISDTLFNGGYTTRNTTKKIADSLGVVISSGLSTKLNISDTATMLSGYKTYYPRTALSAGTGISYNASTGVITNTSTSSGGTVTSIATDATMQGGTITTSGTLKVDTVIMATRLRVQKGIDSLGAIVATKGNGTVTSVATNTGSGITGGTITSTGTIAADTTVLSTKANVTALLLGKLGLTGGSTITTVGTLSSGSIPYSLLTGTPSIPTVSGTTNYIPKFTASSTIGNSLLYDNGTNIGLGSASPNYLLTLEKASSYMMGLTNSDMGTAGQYVGVQMGYSGSTYQKGAIFFESQDGNARGKMYFSLNALPNSSNASISDAALTLDYNKIAYFTSRLNVNGAADNSLFSLNNGGGVMYTNGFSPNASTYSTTQTLGSGTTYVFNGGAGVTWTLPNPSGNNQMYFIKNASANTLTLNAYAANQIIDLANAAQSSISISAGAVVIIQQDGNNKSYILK